MAAWSPRSRCPSCGNAIKSWQNIPVVSYLLLGGKCAKCGESISARYPIVELLVGILAAVCAWCIGVGWEALMAVVMTLALIPISMIDAETWTAKFHGCRDHGVDSSDVPWKPMVGLVVDLGLGRRALAPGRSPATLCLLTLLSRLRSRTTVATTVHAGSQPRAA